MIASLRSDFEAPETSAVHGCAPLNIAPPETGGADGCPEEGCAAEGCADDDDAVSLDGESESPLNMIVATTATTRRGVRRPRPAGCFCASPRNRRECLAAADRRAAGTALGRRISPDPVDCSAWVGSGGRAATVAGWSAARSPAAKVGSSDLSCSVGSPPQRCAPAYGPAARPAWGPGAHRRQRARRSRDPWSRRYR